MATPSSRSSSGRPLSTTALRLDRRTLRAYLCDVVGCLPLLVLFTVVPLAELWLLFRIGDHLGFGATFALVMLTGIVGAALARREGSRVVLQWQKEVSEGRMPSDGVLGGLLVFVGGLLLVTPGVLTDAFGLSLLFPPTRRRVAGWLRERIQRGIASGNVQVMGSVGGMGTSWTSSSTTDVIDVEGYEVPPLALEAETEADD